MPRRDDLFEFSPEALHRVQRAELNGAVIYYVGTGEPDVIYTYGIEVASHQRGQGRGQALQAAVNEHCDALGITRIGVLMSRAEEFPLDQLVAWRLRLGYEVTGEVQDQDTPYPYVWVMRRPR